MRKVALLPAVLLLLMMSTAPGYAQDPGDLGMLRAEALEEVNDDRQAQGLEPLALGEDLNEAALAHAQDMISRDYYAHSSPDGDDVQDRYIAAGGSRWELVAENISRCENCMQTPDVATVERLQRGWMESPGHRENILRPGLSRFGFAVVVDPEQGLYAVQTFAGPGTPRGDAGAVTEAMAMDRQVPVALDAINALRQEAGVPTLSASPALTEVARRLIPADVPDPDKLPGLNSAASDLDRSRWKEIATIVGACGGCGREPAPSDVEAFVEDWTNQQAYRRSLLDAGASRLGFAMRANGEGKKVAVAVLGAAR
ncbi:MAG: CAP domain-containing protein [Pseudorhizobium sp.]